MVVTFTPEDGGTRVVLQHHDLPTDEQRKHHKMGWELYLGRLDALLSGDDPLAQPLPRAGQ